LNRLHEVLEKYDAQTRKRVNIVFHDLKAEINPLVGNFIHRNGKIDTILHLAASSHVDRSITHPMEFINDNTIGTAHLLEFARRLDSLETFLYFSTDEIFGAAPPGVAYTERARYNSTNPYSASKAGGEELAVSYHNTYKLPVYICHTVNVYGHRQHPEKYIPKCIKHILNDAEISVHADPVTDRPGSRHYVHVKDVADALLFILDLPQHVFENDYGGARCPKFNIIGYTELDNLEIAQVIATCMGKELKYKLVDFNTVRPGLDLRYSPSGDLLKRLGWSPKMSFKEHIQELVDWTLEHRHWL
jgi:dTDP-glucose 4,6-dehydratase